MGKESTCNAGDAVLSLGQENPLEKGLGTHSSILAWRIPWTEEPGNLQSIGSQSQTEMTWHPHIVKHPIKHTHTYIYTHTLMSTEEKTF